jgi:lysozyme
MQTSRSGILFIACREALVLTAYADGPHPSIGFGSNSPKLKVGDKITAKAAFDLLKTDIAKREPALSKALKVTVTQPQWDACMSLHFNTGSRYIWDVVKLINAGDIEGAANLFPECDRNLAGEKLAGLHKRRVLEREMFLTGDYGVLDPIPYWPDDPRTTRMQQYHVQEGDLDV